MKWCYVVAADGIAPAMEGRSLIRKPLRCNPRFASENMWALMQENLTSGIPNNLSNTQATLLYFLKSKNKNDTDQENFL